MSDIEIKKLSGLAEYAQLMELQKSVWMLDDYGDCLPEHVMIALKDIGGLTLGAFNGDRIIGFMIAIPGYDEEHGFYHRSHILGIEQEYRSQNIAYKIKKVHRNHAVEMGVSKIDWTYDPLLGPNASLNIAKLGGIVRTYKLNEYGENMGGSKMVSGVPSDRFLCEWFINSERVKERMSGRYKKPVVELNTDNFLLMNDTEGVGRSQAFNLLNPDPSGDVIIIEIPGNYQDIFDNSKENAFDWRTKTRELFRKCFSAGFMVADFVKKEDRNFYILKKDHLI